MNYRTELLRKCLAAPDTQIATASCDPAAPVASKGGDSTKDQLAVPTGCVSCGADVTHCRTFCGHCGTRVDRGASKNESAKESERRRLEAEAARKKQEEELEQQRADAEALLKKQERELAKELERKRAEEEALREKEARELERRRAEEEAARKYWESSGGKGGRSASPEACRGSFQKGPSQGRAPTT